MKSILLSFFFTAWLLAACSQNPRNLPAASGPAREAPLVEASPEAAGFDPARLEKIDALIQEYVEKGWIAGAGALVARHGKIAYHKAIGYDDLARGTSLKRDVIFRIASQTKAVTSVAVMMLAEAGKLSLTDPVSRFVPGFRNPKVLHTYREQDTTYTTVPARREITIKDLLTHTSGIGYAQIGSPEMTAIYAKAGVPGGIGVDEIVLGDKMKILGGLPLFHQPGEKWTYGLNNDLLGYVVEVVSGLSLDTFFRQRIFEPLGMNDTYFYLPASKADRLAVIYTERNGKILRAPDVFDLNGKVYSDYPKRAGTYYSGGGGLSSTAYDYALFMQMLLNGGSLNGKRILKEETVRAMTTDQLEGVPFGTGGFGLGFELAKGKGVPPEGSYSWGGMFSSSYWIDPKNGVIGQFFLQLYPNSHGEIHEKFKQAVYAALKK